MASKETSPARRAINFTVQTNFIETEENKVKFLNTIKHLLQNQEKA